MTETNNDTISLSSSSTESRDTVHDNAKRLSDIASGKLLTILRLPESDENTYRLRELGVIEGSQVFVLKNGDPLLLLVKGTRLAVDRELAARIEVRHA
jgi:Fe2+ transport system protein FeoA